MIDKVLTYEELYDDYITSKGFDVSSASDSIKSEANAYAKCYDWYIEKMKVLPENATLASHIWVDKYALHTQSGVCCEQTPVEMWDRISIVLANEEMKSSSNTKEFSYWKDKFYGILDGWKYSPQGSGLFALGNPYVKASSSNCFHPDSMVTTTNGAKKISDVAIGDWVITHNGNLAKVSQIHKNPLAGRQLYEVKVHGSDSFVVTANHKFYSVSNEQEGWGQALTWNEIGYLRPGDFIALPKNNHSFSDVCIDLADYLDMTPYKDAERGRWIDLVTEEDVISTVRHWKYKHPRHEKEFIANSKASAKLPRHLTLTPRLMRFLGLWYGDGCVFHRTLQGYSSPLGITFTFNQTETELISFVSEVGEEVFHLVPDINHNNKDNTTQVVFHSVVLGIVFRSLFGHGFGGKKLGPKFFNLPTPSIKQLMYGLIESDGSVANTEIRVVMCNPTLMIDLFHLFRANGIQVRHSKLKESLTNFGVAKNCHKLAFTPSLDILSNIQKHYADGRIALKLKKYVEKTQVRQYTKLTEDGTELAVIISKTPIYSELPFVYTLGVDHPDHSYVVEGVVCQNCFTLPPPEDNLESIFDTAKNMARIFAFRGGEGHDISNLRPRGAATNNAARSSTGAASFMDFFSYTTGMIGQSGRRGANLLTLRINHPDIELFIEEKSDMKKQPFFDELASVGININDYKWAAVADRLKSTSHSNVSVRINDQFMKAVKEDGEYELWFEFRDNAYPRISRMIKARVLWDKLMYHAWSSAEPGILNWDHIIRESPADQYTNLPEIEFTDPATGETKWVTYSFETVGLNPCAEEVLSAYDSCNLGLFLLPTFVKNPYTPEASFDFQAYAEVVAMGVRAQDNIKSWDLPILPLEGNRIAGVLGRRISVGNTGLADALAMLGLRYDTDEAIQMAESIYDFLANTAYQTSALLAEEKGSFQIFDWERHKKCPFIQRLSKETQKMIRTKGLRNIGLLTQSPAGSLSILMRNCTSGIEPLFLAAMTRSVKVPGSGDTVQYTVYHQGIQDALNINPDFDISIYVEANSIDYHKRIKMQAAIQRHIDHSISSTVNLPEDATVEDVSQLYMEAFDNGLKGITVYRDKCRTGVLNSIKKEVAEPVVRRERPKTTDIKIHKVKYKDKPWSVLVGLVNGTPIEVFAGVEEDTPLPNKYYKAELVKKSRGHYSLTVWLSEDEESDIVKISNIGARFPSPEGLALTRFISLSLRNGVMVSDICEQLQKSSNSLFDYPSVLNRVLKNYVPDEEAIAKELAKREVCPLCGAELVFKRESGCLVKLCSSCNFMDSKCG